MGWFASIRQMPVSISMSTPVRPIPALQLLLQKNTLITKISPIDGSAIPAVDDYVRVGIGQSQLTHFEDQFEEVGIIVGHALIRPCQVLKVSYVV